MTVIETPARTSGQAHQDASAGPAFYAFLVTHNRSEHGPRYSGSGRRHGRRDRAQGVTYAPGTLKGDIITVVVGVVAWALFAFWLHGALIGVRPFG